MPAAASTAIRQIHGCKRAWKATAYTYTSKQSQLGTSPVQLHVTVLHNKDALAATPTVASLWPVTGAYRASVLKPICTRASLSKHKQDNVGTMFRHMPPPLKAVRTAIRSLTKQEKTALSSLPCTSCCNGNGSADSVQLLVCSLHSVNTVVHHAQLPQLDACSLQCRLDACHAACGSGHSPIACAEDSTAVGEACRQGQVRAQREIPLLT